LSEVSLVVVVEKEKKRGKFDKRKSGRLVSALGKGTPGKKLGKALSGKLLCCHKAVTFNKISTVHSFPFGLSRFQFSILLV
jgi:hypothetical protein